MNSVRRIAGALALVVAVTPATVRAQYLGLFADEAGTSAVLAPPPLGQTTSIYVVLKQSLGLTAVSFALPVPPCVPYSILAVTPMPGIQMVGDVESGIGLAMEECRTGDVPLLKVDLVRTGEPAANCCALAIGVSPVSPIPGEVVGVDCATPDGALTPLAICNLATEGETNCIQLLPPSDPSPTDNSVDVATDVQLDVALHDGVLYGGCAVLSYETVSLYFGTESDPPLHSGGGLATVRIGRAGTAHHLLLARRSFRPWGRPDVISGLEFHYYRNDAGTAFDVGKNQSVVPLECRRLLPIESHVAFRGGASWTSSWTH